MVTITYPTTHLYHRYDGQTRPQGVYLELDPVARTLRADWNGEIGNAVPVSVWHHRILRYNLDSPCYTAATLRQILDAVAPLAERVCDGYSEAWNGSNTVGSLTQDAYDAEGDILAELRSWEPDLNVWEAGQWLGGGTSDEVVRERAGITSATTDEELQSMADRLQAEVDADTILDGDLETALRYLRDNYAD